MCVLSSSGEELAYRAYSGSTSQSSSSSSAMQSCNRDCYNSTPEQRKEALGKLLDAYNEITGVGDTIEAARSSLEADGDLAGAFKAGVVAFAKHKAKKVKQAQELAESVVDAAKDVTKRGGFHEVLTEAPISGTTRSAHRNSANKELANALENDSSFANGMNNLLDKDVLQHMKSGKSGLKNPPGTEWHHPKGNPGSVELLRKEVQRDKGLQDVLHKDGTGGCLV